MSESSDAPAADEPAPTESGPPAGFPIDPEDETPAAPPSVDAGTTRALARLLKASPFLDLHERAGNPTDHRFRGWLCFCLDLLLRLMVVGLLVLVISAIAWKTLAPLPDLFTDGP